jgi:vacuolar-type H+-ATPase subunit H
MEEDILSKVVEVEEEIKQRLEIERKKSRAWIDKMRNDAENEIIAAESGLKESLESVINNAKKNYEEKASKILKNANLKAERFEGLSNEILKGIIKKHISRILPGG